MPAGEEGRWFDVAASRRLEAGEGVASSALKSQRCTAKDPFGSDSDTSAAPSPEDQRSAASDVLLNRQALVQRPPVPCVTVIEPPHATVPDGSAPPSQCSVCQRSWCHVCAQSVTTSCRPNLRLDPVVVEAALGDLLAASTHCSTRSIALNPSLFCGQTVPRSLRRRWCCCAGVADVSGRGRRVG